MEVGAYGVGLVKTYGLCARAETCQVSVELGYGCLCRVLARRRIAASNSRQLRSRS